MDGFILPSRYEGFSLATLEAMATNLLLILTDCPGNSDFKEYGLDQVRWAKAGDVDQLAVEIVKWSTGLRHSSNHRMICLQEFEMQSSYGQILDHYQAASPRRAVTRQVFGQPEKI